MRLHGNARTCLHSRLLIVERVIEGGWTVAAAAEAAGVSERTAAKWLARYRRGGRAGRDGGGARPGRRGRQAGGRPGAVGRARGARAVAPETRGGRRCARAHAWGRAQ